MSIASRLEKGLKAYFSDNYSQNDFIKDLDIGRNLYFDLKFISDYENDLMRPFTKRKLDKSLARLGF